MTFAELAPGMTVRVTPSANGNRKMREQCAAAGGIGTVRWVAPSAGPRGVGVTFGLGTANRTGATDVWSVNPSRLSLVDAASRESI